MEKNKPLSKASDQNIVKSPYYLLVLYLLAAMFVAVFMSLILTLTFAIMDHTVATVLLTIAGAFMLVNLSYCTAWRMGFKDMNKVKFNHIKYNPAKGLIAGLISQIPGLAAAICNTMARYEPSMEVWAKPFYNIQYITLPALTALGDNVHPFFYFLSIFVLPLSAFAGYLLGYRDISVMALIVYKKPGKNEKKR